MKLSLLTLLAVGILNSCSRHAYEEEYDLEVDGSGEIRISGLQELVFALHELGTPNDSRPISVDLVRRRFDSPELRVIEISQSNHEGRSFLHLRARFDDLNQLSGHQVLNRRHFRLDESREHLTLTADIPRGLGPRNDRNTLPKEGSIVFRAHFPSPVQSHNSPTGVERGNVITWKESLVEFDRGGNLHLEAHFARRTVFEQTLILLGASVALVILLIAGSVFVIYRKGRRQLVSDA
jgi:hypothetical protein